MIRQMSNTYSEAFVTDMLGANVAMFPATSDFWQGDEEAFIEAYAGRQRPGPHQRRIPG